MLVRNVCMVRIVSVSSIHWPLQVPDKLMYTTMQAQPQAFFIFPICSSCLSESLPARRQLVNGRSFSHVHPLYLSFFFFHRHKVVCWSKKDQQTYCIARCCHHRYHPLSSVFTDCLTVCCLLSKDFFFFLASNRDRFKNHHHPPGLIVLPSRFRPACIFDFFFFSFLLEPVCMPAYTRSPRLQNYKPQPGPH